MLTRSRAVESRVATLVLLDGVQASTLLTLLPFILFQAAHVRASGFLGATPIGVGFGLGIVGTLLAGRTVDRYSPTVTLQVLQVTQALLLVAAVAGALCGNLPLLCVCSAGMLAVSRSVGPAKDKIRSELIEPSRRTQFNVQVRRYFLVCNEAAAAGCTVAITVLPVHRWSLLLLVPLACVISSLGVTGSLALARRRLNPAAEPRPRAEAVASPGSEPVRPSYLTPRFASGLAIVVLLGLAAPLPSVGLSAWIVAQAAYQPWFVTVIGLATLTVDFWFLKLLGRRAERDPSLWSRLHRYGGALLVVAAGGTALSVAVPLLSVQVPLLIASLLSAVLAYSISVMLAMEIQFGFGNTVERGRIASYTRLSSVVAMSLGTWIAVGVFFGSSVAITIPIVAGIALIVLPASFARAWLRPAHWESNHQVH